MPKSIRHVLSLLRALFWQALAVFGFVGLLLAAAPGHAQAPVIPFPGEDWLTGDPEEYGLDPQNLEEAANYAKSIGSRCLAAVQDGHLVFERNWDDKTTKGVDESNPDAVHNSWSIAKSFTAAVVGVAVTRGDIESLDQPASDYITAWKGTEKDVITIRDLLSGVSGIKQDMISDYAFAVLTADQTKEAVGWPFKADQHRMLWRYNNHAVQTLEQILQVATGRDLEAYAREHLWNKIGMSASTRWERDRSGNVTTYSSVHASCRDMARFGYLLLNGGKWANEQIIAADYVAEMLASSQDINRAYGHLIWLNGEIPFIGNDNGDPDLEMMFPDRPDDLFSAQGVGQNFIDVVPSRGTIYVHLRPAPHEAWINLCKRNPFSCVIKLPGTISALLKDAKLAEHRTMLRLLLD